MGWIGRKTEPPKTEDDKPNKPPPKPSRWRADDDDEDGDIATPKSDRHGPDDEPL